MAKEITTSQIWTLRDETLRARIHGAKNPESMRKRIETNRNRYCDSEACHLCHQPIKKDPALVVYSSTTNESLILGPACAKNAQKTIRENQIETTPGRPGWAK